MKDESYITFPIFDQFRELCCAFSTRLGGHSKGVFASSNMGNLQLDNPQLVKKNRKLFLNKLDIDPKMLALPDQIHSSNIRIISKPGKILKTDALISTEKGVYLGVQTADCLPIFIYAPRMGIVAIVHAGWRGVVQNIITKTLDVLLNQPGAIAADFFVAIGPGLQKECFEVRSDVHNQFPEKFLNRHHDTSKRLLNLSGYVNQQFLSMDIPEKQIYVHRDCTKCNRGHYYSFRRDGKKSGRMMGIIGLRQ
jgi:YfiH family protein